MKTKNCIICIKPAKIWTGHVIKHAEMITAGWCKDHIEQSENMSLMEGAACFGKHKPEYGLLGEDEFTTAIN